jgi:cytochrome c1
MCRLILSLVCGVLAACGGRDSDGARALIAGRCGACHRVPGVAGATGRVGPSLAHIGSQQIIAGFFANNPARLTQWIEHPQQLLPGNAMPEMGLSHAQAVAIVDYLYTMD